MQFSIVAFVAALAATASAVNVPANGTAAAYPTASGATGTGAARPTSTSQTPFTGAASANSGSALAGLIIAGGVAMVRFTVHFSFELQLTNFQML